MGIGKRPGKSVTAKCHSAAKFSVEQPFIKLIKPVFCNIANRSFKNSLQPETIAGVALQHFRYSHDACQHDYYVTEIKGNAYLNLFDNFSELYLRKRVHKSFVGR